MFNRTLIVLFAVCAAPAAYAAADLDVSLSVPSPVGVYANARYDVTVDNIGNRTASNVTVQVDLPETNTSPTVHVMGIMGAISGSCSQAGTTITCNLGRIKKNKSKTIYFDIALPESAAAIEFDITAATTSNENTLANNTINHVANVSYVNTAVGAPRPAHNTHCTGQGLVAYYECVVSPGSTSSHDIQFELGGGITFIPAQPYTGSWSQPTPDSLEFQYIDQNNQVVADFYGHGVGNDCFEGLTLFPGSPWVAPYEVCLQ